MKYVITSLFAFALSSDIFAQQQSDTMFIHTHDQFIHEFATAEIDSIIFYRTQPRMTQPIVFDTVTIRIFDTIPIFDTITHEITVSDTITHEVTIFDTITHEVTVFDTVTHKITISDTITHEITIFDTITHEVTVFDTIGVFDTVTRIDTVFTVCGVTLNPTTAMLTIRETKALIATISPERATNRNVTWLSSDPAIATVSDIGVVAAVAPGNAAITVTTKEGNFTATTYIEVVDFELIFAEDFGTGAASPWPTVVAWDDWNTTGSSAGTILYDGTGVTVRTGTVSGAAWSSGYPGASGGNNVMFSTIGTGGTFYVNRINSDNNRHFFLSFGTNQRSDTLSVSFSTNGGVTWTNIPFHKTTTTWGLVETEFTIPVVVSELRLRFTAVATQFGARIDDIALRGTANVVEIPYLTVTPENLTFHRDADTREINITSNIDWTISTSASWLSVSEVSGSNSGTVFVFVDENTTGVSRSATLAISGPGASNQIVDVEQRHYAIEPILIFRETFGNPASNTLITNYSGWVREGVGASNVTYSAVGNVDVRTSLSSPPPFSGQGSVFFPTSSANERALIISSINPGNITNFTLSFVTQAQAASVELFVEYSIDGFSWTDIFFYTETTGDWGLVETGFEISEPTSNLRLRFRVPAGTTGNFRLDDITLTERISTGVINISGSSAITDPAQTVRFRIETTLPSWTAEITSGHEFAEIVPPTSGTGNGFVDIAFQERNPESAVRNVTLQVTAANRSVNKILTQGRVFGNPERYVPFRLELPLVVDSTWFIQHSVGDVVNFALEYDTAQRHAFWVAYQLTAAHLARDIDRANFTFDPKIPEKLQPHQVRNGLFITPSYAAYGYERGHIMASADRTSCQTANDQSNFMSNISPHLPEFHGFLPNQGVAGQGIWLRLEHLVRSWAELPGVDTLYVVKGGSIIPDAQGTVIDTILTERNRTVAPRWHFKALVQRRGDSFYGIAFWVRQYSGMERRAPRQEDAMTIRELEEQTRINFFPNLGIYGARIGQPNLENDVETTAINWNRWPGIN